MMQRFRHFTFGSIGQKLMLAAVAAACWMMPPARPAIGSPSEDAAAEAPAEEAAAAASSDSRPVGTVRDALRLRRGKASRPLRQIVGRLRAVRSARTSAEPAPPDPFAWKSLFDGKTLDGWKVPKFGGEGDVTVEDGQIVIEVGASMSGVTYTGEVLRNNYELELEGMRLSGADFFCTTTFPVGKDPCSLVVGGWGGTVVGLSNVDFYDASDNPTTTFREFKDNQWYKVRIRVTDAKIQAWIDDEQVVDQVREGHRFDIRFEVDLCKPLGVSSWDTKAALRNIRLRKLKPEEIVDQPEEEE